ncbi:hypothetical protein GCM10009111_13130 [Colwellia asteriadis]|uniref:Type II secretion system protein n=2 Tax=Colwellia asteriadis TaxID=517723 RepID=A0ABN1L5I9_9GAMM
MTLVEVLIAGIILFIAISAISMVARTKILNEQRLARAVEHAYLTEFSHGRIKYYLTHTDIREGNIRIANTQYQWRALAKNASPPMIGLDNGEGMAGASLHLLTLYNVIVSHVGTNKKVYGYTELVWTMP